MCRRPVRVLKPGDVTMSRLFSSLVWFLCGPRCVETRQQALSREFLAEFAQLPPAGFNLLSGVTRIDRDLIARLYSGSSKDYDLERLTLVVVEVNGKRYRLTGDNLVWAFNHGKFYVNTSQYMTVKVYKIGSKKQLVMLAEKAGYRCAPHSDVSELLARDRPAASCPKLIGAP